MHHHVIYIYTSGLPDKCRANVFEGFLVFIWKLQLTTNLIFSFDWSLSWLSHTFFCFVFCFAQFFYFLTKLCFCCFLTFFTKLVFFTFLTNFFVYVLIKLFFLTKYFLFCETSFGETLFGELHLAKLHLTNFIWQNFI